MMASLAEQLRLLDASNWHEPGSFLLQRTYLKRSNLELSWVYTVFAMAVRKMRNRFFSPRSSSIRNMPFAGTI